MASEIVSALKLLNDLPKEELYVLLAQNQWKNLRSAARGPPEPVNFLKTLNSAVDDVQSLLQWNATTAIGASPLEDDPRLADLHDCSTQREGQLRRVLRRALSQRSLAKQFITFVRDVCGEEILDQYRKDAKHRPTTGHIPQFLKEAAYKEEHHPMLRKAISQGTKSILIEEIPTFGPATTFLLLVRDRTLRGFSYHDVLTGLHQLIPSGHNAERQNDQNSQIEDDDTQRLLRLCDFVCKEKSTWLSESAEAYEDQVQAHLSRTMPNTSALVSREFRVHHQSRSHGQTSQSVLKLAGQSQKSKKRGRPERKRRKTMQAKKDYEPRSLETPSQSCPQASDTHISVALEAPRPLPAGPERMSETTTAHHFPIHSLANSQQVLPANATGHMSTSTTEDPGPAISQTVYGTSNVNVRSDVFSVQNNADLGCYINVFDLANDAIYSASFDLESDAVFPQQPFDPHKLSYSCDHANWVQIEAEANRNALALPLHQAFYARG